jgi:hypothetical protein
MMAKTKELTMVLVLASGMTWAAMKAGTSPAKAVAPNGSIPVESGTRTARPQSQSAPSAGEKLSRDRIVYIQLLRYKGTTTPHIEELLRSAEQTFGAMPEVRAIRAGQITTDSSQSYDYALIMEFDNMSDLTAYGNSGVHRQWVEQNHVAPLLQNHLMVTIQPLLDLAAP